MERRRVGTIAQESSLLGLGCWAFGGSQWGGQEDEDSCSAILAALDSGVNHLDTAQGYGSGRSEKVVGTLMPANRERVFLATKMFVGELTPEAALKSVEVSLSRLATDSIDLFYIHWPRTGKDLRPIMTGLEMARSQGKIHGIGVSNFSVEQMEQVMEVGTIDGYQVGYSLFWRWPERDIMPFCREHGISLITYSSIAQGILTGKFGPNPSFPEDDQRKGNVLFDPAVYPHLYEGVEQMKKVAEDAGRPLVELAIRWCSAQPGVASVLVGARNAGQVHANLRAMDGDISPATMARLTAISDEVHQKIPNTGNIFRFYP